MQISIENSIFENAPHFQRIVLFCSNLDNKIQHEELKQLLEEAQNGIIENVELDNYKEHHRIESWIKTLNSFGVNTNANPPSIMQLVKRLKKGKKIPYINSLVTIFNIVSLRYILPLGGDDLSGFDKNAVLTLGLSTGKETYFPLGKPEKSEIPKIGEPTYFDSLSGDVLCRFWCVKNSNLTKITEKTETVIINIDCLPPITSEEHLNIAEDVRSMIANFCNGSVDLFILNKEHPQCEILVN